MLARAFEIFRRNQRLGLGAAFERFIFEVVLRKQAQRQVVVLNGRIIGFGAGPKGSRIVDFLWRGIFLEAKLSQAAFDFAQFQAFVAAARNGTGQLWYFFLKAPSDDFVNGIAQFAQQRGVTVQIFSLVP